MSDPIPRSSPMKAHQPNAPSSVSSNSRDAIALSKRLIREADQHWTRIFGCLEALRKNLDGLSAAQQTTVASGTRLPEAEGPTEGPGAPLDLSVLLGLAGASMQQLQKACREAVPSQECLYKECSSLAATIDRMEAENRRLRAALSERHAEVAGAAAMIRQAEADRLALRGAEIRLERMMRSLSWRVTEPLRVIDGLLRGEPAHRQALLDRLSPRHLLRLRPNARTLAARHLESTATRLPHRVREEGVSIIVCVHNALPDVRRCLYSVLASTLPPFELVLIDDGSDEETREFLKTAALQHQATLIRHPTAQGYTRAANKGLASAKMPWLVLLNSDTVVSNGWLDGLVAAGVQHERIGLVGPVSNTASWQSLPFVESDGDWAQNPLPPDMDITEMAHLVAAASRRQPIDLPFLNGFCLLIRRAVLNELGPFDDQVFGAGFGEENDYCIRARQAGWRLVVADDVYVYHAQSRSYSHERRFALAKKADEALARKWSWREIGPAVECCRTHLALAASRQRVLSLLAQRNALRAHGQRFEGKRLAFALPSGGAAGGTNVVLQEISALQEAGVDVWIVNLTSNRMGFEQAYPGVETPCLYARDIGEARRLLAGSRPAFDAVIATLYSTVEWLPRASSIRCGYYIQDFEPWFFSAEETEYERARLSYGLRPDATLLTKTRWTCSKVAELGVKRPTVVGPSVDTRLYLPPNRAPRGRGAVLSIAGMVRVDMGHQRRAPALTARVLRRLSARFGKRIAISIFGSTPAMLRDAGIDTAGLHNLGVLQRTQCADVLQEADVFCDFSEWQAMGLTALEAMACGCATVVPEHGGATDFAIDGVNALVVDTRDEQACFDAAARLIADDGLRQRLQVRAISAATAHAPWRAAYAIMDALFPPAEPMDKTAHD